MLIKTLGSLRFGIILGIVLSVLLVWLNFDKKILAVVSKNSYRYVVAIDPGHGGIDPGKIASDGTYEKTINLSIAKKLGKILQRNHCKVIFSREEDKGLYEEYDQNKKVTDMRKRVELLEEDNPDLVVSIHQNSFGDGVVSGAQVFYYQGSNKGQQLASMIQESIREQVDAKNQREPKSNGDYYLLKKISRPAVIVECGFLSNPREAELLKDEEYQERMAMGISVGILNYLNFDKDKK